MGRYIYYPIEDGDELLGYVRAYSDGHMRDFELMEREIHSVLGRSVKIPPWPHSGDLWTQADSLAAMGVPIVIYDPEGRRDDADKYSDETECVSCDWTKLTDFPSLRAMSPG